MNRKLFLSLALLVLISNAQGNMECFSGQKILGFPMSGMPAPQSVTCNDDQTCMVFKMRVRMQVQGINMPEMMMEIGNCADPSACSQAKCDLVKRQVAAAMANTPMSMSIVQCNKTCNEPASAGATPAQMPILPNIGGGVPAQMPVLPGGGVPEQMPVLSEGGAFPAQMPVLEGNGRVCSLPMLGSMEVRDNKILENSRPHFILKVAKAERRGYKPGKPYKIIIRATKPKKLKFTGFVATLSPVNSSSCGLGKFLGSRKRIMGAPIVGMGCDQPLTMGLNQTSRVEVKKSSDAKWLAPRCEQPGLVMIKVVVRGSDNRLYRDNEMMGSEHWELTKILRPKLKKKKPRRPHHNGGRRRKNRRREQN